jgi:hypothetical protein
MSRPKRLYKWTELPDDVGLVHEELSEPKVLEIREKLIKSIWVREIRAFYSDGTPFEPTIGHVSVHNPPHLVLADGQRWLARAYPALSWSPDRASAARLRLGPGATKRAVRRHEREDKHYEAMVKAGLIKQGEIPARMPKGTGEVADSLGLTRQNFTKSVQNKCARMRAELAKRNQNNT